jgi:hypothetical protein
MTATNAPNLYNVTNEDFRVIERWALAREASWPPSIPKDSDTIVNIVAFIRLMDWQIKEYYLDKSLQSFLDFEVVKQEFPKYCHPNLRNAQGLVADDNMATLMRTSFHEFGKKLTVDSLNDATKLAHSRGQIRWETPLPTAAHQLNRNVSNDVARRVKSKAANTLSRVTGEVERVHSEADKEAQQKVHSLYRASDATQQNVLGTIIQKHRDAGLPWMATLTEVSAWQWVERQLAHPPGATHLHFDSVRSSIREIIADEQAASANNPTIADATWNRVARRVQEEVLSRYDRGVR